MPAVTAPTGSVTEKNAAGLLTHYGMQLGSGTWDFTPNITYTGHSDRLGWGAQMDAIIRLEDENEVGFAFGNQYGVNGWLSFLATDWLSTSLRLRYSHEDAISGGYDEPASSMSPADNPDNYGGEFWEIGVGVNLVSPSGWSKGLRVGLEWIDIFSADYNGVQLAQDDNLQVNVSYAF